jgi:peptidoglycan/xylan/chitin deacetylase (PgdA/CDA1 family)
VLPREARTDRALRLAAFPRQQFSAERLGGNPRAGKRIALTFDDGPVPGWTEKYLEVLREKRVPATFFFVGRSAAEEVQLVRKVAADGHEIGAHSYSHRKLTLLTKPQLEEDFWAAGTALYEITKHPIAYFRPPYGASNANVLKTARELGQTVILWNIDPRDWEAPNAETIINHVLTRVRPGAIVLLHEGKPVTYEALPALIDKLRAKGYEFVTVSQLFGFSLPEENRVALQEQARYGRVGR